MCAGNEHLRYKIIFTCCSSGNAFTTARLPSVTRYWVTFYEAAVTDRNNHFFFSDHVFDVKLFGFINNFGTAVIAVLFFHFSQFIFYNFHLKLFAFQNGFQLFYKLYRFTIFVFHFFTFKTGQALETHI